jgi:hypothetical protein
VTTGRAARAAAAWRLTDAAACWTGPAWCWSGQRSPQGPLGSCLQQQPKVRARWAWEGNESS